jgi:hypothetical protein
LVELLLTDDAKVPARFFPDGWQKRQNQGLFATTFGRTFPIMKHVSILVPQEAVLAAVDDPRHVFTEVNNFLASQGQPPVFGGSPSTPTRFSMRSSGRTSSSSRP